MQSALRMQGFALVQDHGVLKVVPEADAKLQGVPTYVGNTPVARGDQVITQVFELKNESANNLLPVLRPLISPNNTSRPTRPTTRIVVTDYADNVRRIAQIIAGIDTAAGQSVSVVPLKNANAIDIADATDQAARPGRDRQYRRDAEGIVTADPRTNSLLIRASSGARLAAAKQLAKELDAPTAMPGNMHVVALRNADATTLAKTLRGDARQRRRQRFSSGSGSNEANSFNQIGGGGGSGSNSTGTSGTPPLPSGGLGSSTFGVADGRQRGRIRLRTAVPATRRQRQEQGRRQSARRHDPGRRRHQLADHHGVRPGVPQPARGDRPARRAARAGLYRGADRRVELATTNANLGIQWQVANGSTFAGTNLATGSGNSIVNLTAAAAVTATNPAGLAGALTGLQQGLNVGWVHNIFGVQGLGALLQALSQTADANVLSTPNLITLDNEEAKIVVGTNVPIQTGSYSNLTSSTATSAFNTFDRVDVGLTLHIKPQITDGGILKLQLYTEDSAIVNGTTNATTNPAGPEFTKRSIQSTVLADNGEIIVLGGLMQDNYQVSNSKVPLLGDIPWIGQLFRSEQKTRNKTNLMVFLRPVIISDRDTAQAVTSNRYDYVQGVTGAYKSDNNLIKDKDDPVVPPMPIGPSQGGSPAMNLFNLDQMRRQQLAPPPGSAPAPVTNGGAVQTNPVTNGGTVQTNPVMNGGAVQTNPVMNGGAVQTNPVPAPSTASPGVQP